jgi:hypothetical protein
MDRVRRHLSYSNVVATLALVIAVAGGATAVAGGFAAPKNSVTSKSIKAGNVTSRDLGKIVSVTVPGQLTDSAPGDGIDATVSLSPSCPSGGRVISVGGGGLGTHIVTIAPSGTGATVIVGTDRPGTWNVTGTVRCLQSTPGQPQG